MGNTVGAGVSSIGIGGRVPLHKVKQTIVCEQIGEECVSFFRNIVTTYVLVGVGGATGAVGVGGFGDGPGAGACVGGVGVGPGPVGGFRSHTVGLDVLRFGDGAFGAVGTVGVGTTGAVGVGGLGVVGVGGLGVVGLPGPPGLPGPLGLPGPPGPPIVGKKPDLFPPLPPFP